MEAQHVRASNCYLKKIKKEKNHAYCFCLILQFGQPLQKLFPNLLDIFTRVNQQSTDSFVQKLRISVTPFDFIAQDRGYLRR
jgi:hypothetical protein